MIRLWDVENKLELGYIPESQTTRVEGMVFLPDSSLVTVGGK
jgi:hypothetical protein